MQKIIAEDVHLLHCDVAPHGELDGALEARDDEERVVVLVVHGELQSERPWKLIKY